MVKTGSISFRGFSWRPFGRDPLFVDFDLEINPGERIALIGPSGSGKSTVLHALVGVLGNTIAGDVSGVAETGGTVGLLTQNSSVVANTLGRDVAFGLENLGVEREEIWRRVDESLGALGLDYGRDHPSDALSGGENQRLGLAGLLAMQPNVLLLDEPTAMLDEDTAVQVRSKVRDVVERTGATTIIVEHRIGPWLNFVDRVIVLNQGRLDSADNVDVWLPERATPAIVLPQLDLIRPRETPRSFDMDAVDVLLQRRTVRGTLKTQALRNFSMRAQSGALTTLRGRSGSGKSTALEVLGGLRKPDAGMVNGFDKPPHELSSVELASIVSWTPQNPEHGFLTTSVAAEVARTAHVFGRDVDVEAILDHFGLAHLAQVNPFRLSGGEQRRLAIAAAGSHHPALALFDEPTVGQDPYQWARIVGWLQASVDVGVGVVAATHDELLHSDEVVRL